MSQEGSMSDAPTLGFNTETHLHRSYRKQAAIENCPTTQNPAQCETEAGTPQMAFIKQINKTLHPKPESLVPEAMHGAINWEVFKKE